MWAFTQGERFVNLRASPEIVVRVQDGCGEIAALCTDGEKILLGTTVMAGKAEDTLANLKSQIRMAMTTAAYLDIPEVMARSAQHWYQGIQSMDSTGRERRESQSRDY